MRERLTGRASRVRRAHAPRASPALLGAAACAGLLSAYLALDAVLGSPTETAGEPPWARSDVRAAAVVALLTGYVFAAGSYARRGVERCMSDLQRVLCCSAGEHAALEKAALAFFSPRPSLATYGGAALGILVFEGSGVRSSGAWEWSWELLWWLPVEATLMGVISGGVYAMVRVAGFFSWLGEGLERLDLLDVSALAPFARLGLSSALLWIVGTSIASLLFLEGRGTAMVAAIMIAILVLATLMLLLPLRGVRRRIRRAKAEELARVLQAIRRERGALVESRRFESRAGNATMVSLLAYREFVESIREWPLDAPTVTRFALYVSIGIGSWVGAAVVERLLEVALS